VEFWDELEMGASALPASGRVLKKNLTSLCGFAALNHKSALLLRSSVPERGRSTR